MVPSAVDLLKRQGRPLTKAFHKTTSMRLNHRFVIPAAVLLALGHFAGAQVIVTAPTDDIIGALHDLDNHYSNFSNNYPGGEDPKKAIDGDISTKYLNFDGAGLDDNGNRLTNPTGFLLTLSTKGPAPINGFRLATGNDAPSRDPAMITIEGTNRAGTSTDLANTDDDSDWTLIYSGQTGLHVDQVRTTWGDWITFPTSDTYKSYRVIITDLIRYADNAPTNSQFGEIQLANNVVPEPASIGLLGVGGLLCVRRRRPLQAA
jgi:hypothetical protein